MKTKSLAVSWLGVALLVAVFAVADASAAGQVSLSSNSGPGYALVHATASGFQSYSNNFYDTGFWIDNNWAGVTCSPIDAGPDSGIANCTVDLRMPTVVGPHTVKAANPAPPGIGDSGTATFNVLPPTCSIAPACGPVGTLVTVIGHNYPATYPVEIQVDGGPSGHVATADEAGGFTITFPIGSYGDGLHTIVGQGAAGVEADTFLITTNCVVGAAVAPVGATVTHRGGQPQKLNPNDPIQFGDFIETGAGAQVHIQFIDNTQIVVGENTKLTVDQYVYDPDTHAGSANFSVLRGVFVYTSGLIGHQDPDNVRVETPYGSIGVRGTEFVGRKDPCSTTQEVYLISGRLAITPLNTGVTNICDAPVTILFDASTVTTSALSQATYDALVAEVNQTNPVTFASWQVQYFGCTNNNPAADATADPDGDGQNNMAEFLAGTDPTDSASAFRILNVARTNGDMRVCWFTHAGLTNVLQAATDLTGTYSNVSPNLVITGTTNSDDVVTNYIESGGATNIPGRYYRVRLVP